MNSIALLDGGLGQEINSRSTQSSSHPLWSVQVMHQEPNIVTAVHNDFIKAGAKVLSLNNYTASLTRLSKNGIADQFEATHKLAIELAERAVEQSAIERSEINVAGCLMPLAASYVASAALDYTSSYDEYCKIIEAQMHGVDIFLVETMSNITEAKAAADALASFNQPVYISLTLKDDQSNQLRSGESIEQAIDKLSGGRLDALMINCCYPEAIDEVMPVLSQSGLRIGAYANGFTSIQSLQPGGNVDALNARQDLTPEKYTDHALQWVEAGATIIGGCCEIGPAHIAHLNQALRASGYETAKLI